MADSMTPEQRHACMSHIHSKDTGPERAVRRELWRRGYRFRLHVRALPGSPDIVLSKYRTVLFVNGCFWHGHKGCPKYVLPKSNIAFWREKIARNQERDLLNNQRLETLAWHVVTVWECELDKARFAETMDRIETEIRAGQAAWQAYRERRRWDRVFAREQARLRRLILADVQAELDKRYDIPPGVKKMARRESL
jgi:DNA mismatch endonuclease (patch repair protein)